MKDADSDRRQLPAGGECEADDLAALLAFVFGQLFLTDRVGVRSSPLGMLVETRADGEERKGDDDFQ